MSINGLKDSPVIVTVPPSETEEPLIVMLEFVKLELPILLKVLLDPDIVLLVRVSVVARPTKVSVLVGRVRVPVLLIVEIIGDVKVLFVSV